MIDWGVWQEVATFIGTILGALVSLIVLYVKLRNNFYSAVDKRVIHLLKNGGGKIVGDIIDKKNKEQEERLFNKYTKRKIKKGVKQ